MGVKTAKADTRMQATQKPTPATGRDPYRASRFFYIIEAALEYFIAILVGESYLAKVTTSMGMSDALTGILSSLVSVGSLFRIVAVFLSAKGGVKRWVTPLHAINNLLFVMIYVVPLLPLKAEAMTVVFILCLLGGHTVHQIVYSPKINWFMSLVDDKQRGTFTANKEIVSLLGGMAFTFVMGSLIDRFEAQGNMRASFVTCAITVLILTVGHTAMLLLSREKPSQAAPTPVKENLRSLARDKGLWKILAVYILWNFASHCVGPFLGAYKVRSVAEGGLGFSMTLIAVLSAVHSLTRVLFSRPMGRFADRTSFSHMLTLCFGIQAVAYFLNMFATPQNGIIFYTLYYILHAIAMAGINSGAINLVYDYVPREKRTAALAINGVISGTVGFLTALVAAIPMDAIQKNGNKIGSFTVYAPQVLSAVSCVLTVVILLYVHFVIDRMKRPATPTASEADA